MKKLIKVLFAIFGFMVLSAGTAVSAQDFYGEGNVLIAVDMASYEENGDVKYNEGTFGKIVWGDDAPEGESTRPAFNNKKYKVPDDVVALKAEDYEITEKYKVGQKLFYTYYRADDPDIDRVYSIEKGLLPEELFDENGNRLFLIADSCVGTRNGKTVYSYYCEKDKNGGVHPCCDFLEIECIKVTDHMTLWRYTGNACSTRTGFDPKDYVGAVELTQDEIDYITDSAHMAFTKEAGIFGDPRELDKKCDRDGKLACVVLDLEELTPLLAGVFADDDKVRMQFDCLRLNVNVLSDRFDMKKHGISSYLKSRHTIFHEFNHYIMYGKMNDYGMYNSSIWLGEAFAQYAAALFVGTEDMNGVYSDDIKNNMSIMRVMPGLLWDYYGLGSYVNYIMSSYSISHYFLRYIEYQTTGEINGRLWTEYISSVDPNKALIGDTLSKFLVEKTGEDIDAWMAQFMAALVVGADEGIYRFGSKSDTEANKVNYNHFLRDSKSYGTLPSFDNDCKSIELLQKFRANNFYAVQGGGTTYAFQKNGGGKIAITGADDRWYFFAVNMDIPDKPTSIRKSDLNGNTGYEYVYISENIEKIGAGTFKNCKKLDLIIMHDSVKKIGKNAFKGIKKNAQFKIIASEEDYKRIVKLIKKSGVSKKTRFLRADK